MKKGETMFTTGRLPAGCACCSRRRLLSGFAGAAGAGALTPLLGCRSAPTAPPGPPARVRVIYSLHAPVQPRPDWPNKGFDFRPVMERINAALAKGCPGYTFIPTMANGPDQAKKILAEDAKATANPVDGYVVYQMNCWNRVVQTIATSGKPVLYADFLYAGSGGFLVYSANFIRKGAKNVGFISSSRLGDVVEAARGFGAAKAGGAGYDFAAATARLRTARTPETGDPACKADALKAPPTDTCVKRLKASKILAVRDNKQSGAGAPILEIPLERVTFGEVNDAWKAADKDASKAIADRWQKTARVVRDVSRETLESSAAMYLGMKAVLKKHGANAITINCLGGFYGGHIHAYPCLGFHELNNEGLVGACECDVRSTATMVLITTLTQGRPGYISDPVLDIAKRQIIYAHCVASNRVFGPEGPTNPFEILTHSEDRQGAAVRSILPTGYLTTSMKVDQRRKEIIFHQGKAVDNDPNDRACRTKLCAEPLGDFEKLFAFWDRWGWHRVTAYGDLKQPVQAVADALGWTVVHEA
jgi:hypothetical protein